jgi:hypothetical protein
VYFEHGTGPEAAENVRVEGLQPNHGGRAGGGSENQRYRDLRKGKVHVSVPIETGVASTAPRYARYGANTEAQQRLGIPLTKELYDEIPEHVALINKIEAESARAPGVVFHGAIPYREFNPNFSRDLTMLGDAFHTEIPISPAHFGSSNVYENLWRNRDPDLLGYILKHPKRFLRGAAVPATAALLLAGGAGLAYSHFNKDRAAKTAGINAALSRLGLI